MPAPHAEDRAESDHDTLIFSLKTSSAITVDRTAVDAMNRATGLGTSRLVHLALARLRDEILRRNNSAFDLMPPLATAWPTTQEIDAIRTEVDKGRSGSGSWQGSAALDSALAQL